MQARGHRRLNVTRVPVQVFIMKGVKGKEVEDICKGGIIVIDHGT